MTSEPAAATGPSKPRNGSEFRLIKTVAIVVAAIVVLFIGTVWIIRSSSSPRALLAALEDASGDEREQIVIRLNLARGDVVGPMIEAFRNTEKPAAYRAAILELLFKRFSRTKAARVKKVLEQSLKDESIEVVRKAAYCYSIYLERDAQVPLVELVSHPDVEVRKQVYMMLCAEGRWRRRGLWRYVSRGEGGDERRDKLVADVVELYQKETDPELKFLARSVLGRRIEELCNEATQAAQRSDPLRAEDLLKKAFELDPENHQARIRAARLQFSLGGEEAAIAMAGEYGALLSIPLLPAAPAVDGDPTDDAWKSAFSSQRFFLTNSRWSAKPATGRTEMRIGHHDGRLYIAILAYEDDLDALVVKHTTRDGDIWRDDCVELFFDPDNAGKRAYQFVINAGNAYFDSFGGNKSKNFQSDHATDVFKDRGYWCCEFGISASEFNDAKITSNSIWGVDVMRTRIGGAAEQQAWWPTFGSSHRYHLYPIAVFQNAPEPEPETGEAPTAQKEPADRPRPPGGRRPPPGPRPPPPPRR